jgi:hypothetical protein
VVEVAVQEPLELMGQAEQAEMVALVLLRQLLVHP